MNDIIEIHGWKGEGDLQINYSTDQEIYIIKEYRKEKETKETKENTTKIPKVNVETLLRILTEYAKLNQEYKYKWVVRKILQHYKFHDKENVPIEYFMEAFNGGKNRSKYYFPYYYYPMKVLEAQKKIRYLGRGGVILNDS